MTPTQLAYLVFGIVIVISLLFDLGLLNKRNKTISIRSALIQTVFWVSLSLAFFAFVWWDFGQTAALKYITAYLMEWSLSVDNIFVFILIFGFFKVKPQETGRVLLIGIILAIIFRILFIAVGIELINRFHWLLYVFGGILVYTGIKLFFSKEDEEYNPADSAIFRIMSKYLKVSKSEANGKFVITENGKRRLTNLALVVIMLAGTDIIFALDSIPTVVSLVRDDPKIPFSSSDILIIYSSNIFAILGLRSLFFLLKGAADKFDYLQQGIAVVLIFIGVKMLLEIWHIKIPVLYSLGVIVLCLGSSIVYSQFNDKKKELKAEE